MYEFKERLKKIKWLRKTVRAIKALPKKAKTPFNRLRSTYYLKKKKEHYSDKIRIGFIVQGSTSWDKIEDVYEIARAREDIETFLFVVPPENFDTYEIIPDYTDNFFCNKYPESIKAMDENGVCLDLAKYHLDYLFYQRPYDYRLPKELRSDRMVKYTKCCYIPYAFTAFEVFHRHMLKDEFFDNQYLFFAESAYVKSSFEKKYWYSSKKKIRRIEFLGYPSFEKYLNLRGKDSEGYVTWTPRWSFDKVEGGSTFIIYKDYFLEFIRKTRRKAIFRPHPLIHAEIIRSHIMSEEEWNNYLNELRKLDVVIDMESPIDEILEKTDILISDYSSIIISFFLTGRPVVYCDNGVVLTDEYMEMMKNIYIANSWDDVEKFYGDIDKGNDYMKNQREVYVEENYACAVGSTGKIVDCVCEDWK
jgi:hypothetical protein